MLLPEQILEDSTDGPEFYRCCKMCGKLSKSDMFDGAGTCLDGTGLVFIPSRGSSLAVCGPVKTNLSNWQVSPCESALRQWINNRIDEGWQGFPCRFD